MVDRGGTNAPSSAREPDRRRRLLIVSRSIPEPAVDGYRIRVAALARGVARHADVTLVGYWDGSDPDDIARIAADGIDAHAAPTLHHRTPRRRFERLVTGRPWVTRVAEDRRMRAIVASLTSERAFDLIQLEGREFAALPMPPGVPVLIDEHNIGSELAARRRAVRAGISAGLDAYETRQLRRLEERAWRRAAAVAFCSDRERFEAAARVPSGRYATVPNGVDPERFHPGHDGAPPVVGRIVFVGLLRYTPNADAARWLVEDILPHIRRQVSVASLDIVGREPSPHTLALAGDGVRVLGSVPDVRPYLAAAEVAVAPLRVGSGTRIKILEAMAAGRPVVSTTLGAEGLGVRDGEHLLLADDAASFAEAVVRLLRDPALREGIAAAGRAFVLDGHTWQASVDRLRLLHDDILERTMAPDERTAASGTPA